MQDTLKIFESDATKKLFKQIYETLERSEVVEYTDEMKKEEHLNAVKSFYKQAKFNTVNQFLCFSTL